MKRLFVVISGLLVLPAFAEVAPQYLYDEGVLILDEENVQNESVPEQNVTAEEATQPVAPVTQTNRNSNPTLRASTRTTSPRVSTSRQNVRRTTATRTTRGVSARDTSNRQTVARVGVTGTPVVSVNNNSSVSQGTNANTTRISTLGGRTTPLYNGVSTRVSGARIATANVVSSGTSNASATNAMDNLAEMTDYCKAQYSMCMDNYCNVLDDNQGRCTCSPNVTNYAKTEEALAAATEALQDVAQEIQYIGLSGEDVEILFKETEAELVLTNAKDTSKIQSSLDKIKRMIVDVQSGKSTSSSAAVTSGLSMDLSGLLDFSFDSNGFDLSSLLMTTRQTTSTSSISNQRGANLYKTAAARCKASVLNTCANQGVDISIITNGYDLEIDKACLAYERALTDANDNMTATVRNAKSVLQKARLMVAQNKNVYDLRGCVEALDSCMQSDFVCGTDYEGCLDTTGKYIVDGEIVVGSEPGRADSTTGLYATTWGTGTASPWDTGDLITYINSKVTNTAQSTTSNDMATYLQYRIGYHDDSDKRNYGMCISVLNQCQNYTYDKSNGSYKPANMVITEYLTRTLPRIKAAQDEKLAEYAESCITDVESCLTANNYDAGKEPDVGVNKIAVNACKATITTCKSVNLDVTASVEDVKTWVKNVMDGTLSSLTTE